MTITHRIARQAAREVTLREATRREIDASMAASRDRDRAAATEQWPPVTVEERVAVLDMYTRFSQPGRPVLSFDATLRSTYGVSWTELVRVVVGLVRDPEVYAQRPAECKRLDRMANVRAGRRSLRRAS